MCGSRFAALLCSLPILVACSKATTPTSSSIPRAHPTSEWTAVIVTTIAGSGPTSDLASGYRDGPVSEARFRRPAALAMDATGRLYVADEKNHRIRVISGDVVSTLAGGGPTGPIRGGYEDGPAEEARFADPIGLCTGPDGSVYVADSDNQRIRLITPNAHVHTLAGTGDFGKLIGGYADGPASSAQFNRPYDVMLDTNGNLYVADYFNNAVRKISPDGLVSTLAGNGLPGHRDGPATDAQLAYPNRLAVDGQGNLYLTEGHSGDIGEWVSGNYVRKITPQGTVSTLAGNGAAGYADGPALEAEFNTPMGVDVDADGNVYVAEYLNHCIRVVTSDGQVHTLAGCCGVPGYRDGPGETALFSYPMDVLVSHGERLLYVADFGNHRVRAVTLPQGTVQDAL